MSTNGQLVFTDVDKITFKGVGNASNAVVDTLTGKIGVGVDSPDANLHVLGNSYVSTNLELGGTLIMGTVNVEAQHSLEAVTATGNTTPLTVEFTNATTSLVASGNVVVTGNVTADYFVGDGSNITGISSNLDQIVNIGNVTSNTVQFSNAITSLTAASNVVVTGNVTAGSFLGDGSELTALNAANIGSGTLDVARVPNLNTSILTAGTLDVARVPNLNTSILTAGTLDVARVPNLDAAKITTGTLDVARVPNLDAAKITTGTLDDDRIPSLNTSKLGAGTLDTTRGGTGTTSVTGSGSMVKSSGPIFSTGATVRGSGNANWSGSAQTYDGKGLRIDNSSSSSSYYWQFNMHGNNNLHIGARGMYTAYLNANASDKSLNFTGQHRTFIKDTPFTEAKKLEGLIVSADQNKYIKMNGGIEASSNAITVNESLPLVSLSVTTKDKKCFGVISTSEDPEMREDHYGRFVSIIPKENGDTRVYINSVGEGAIWVTNINGPLESGDYITTSDVAGYGQKQDDDILHNYTVAKITMDCDFDPATQPVQVIKKDEDGENVLDEHNQIQWEDHPTETEKAYKIRYLDASGVETDEANAVHKAAFVGCTYHCG